MKKQYTKQDIHAAVQANWEAHLASLALFPEGAELNVTTRGRYAHAWACGEWLFEVMKSQGATDQEANDAAFAMGQMGVFGDPYQATADVLARWQSGNPVKPGLDLANEINTLHITPVDGGLMITRDPVFKKDGDQ